MKVKKFTVLYTIKEGFDLIDMEFDKALMDALKPLGYECWASGCGGGERDMVFDLIEEEDRV